jgi:hypothetical protein
MVLSARPRAKEHQVCWGLWLLLLLLTFTQLATQGDANVHEEARWQRLAASKKRDDVEESQQAEHTQKERATFLDNAGKVCRNSVLWEDFNQLESSRLWTRPVACNMTPATHVCVQNAYGTIKGNTLEDSVNRRSWYRQRGDDAL